MAPRLIAALASTLVLGCITAPAASAADNGDSAASPAKSAIEILSAVKSVRFGMSSITITIQNGKKTHPIVLDYRDALKTGVLDVGSDEATSSVAQRGVARGSARPKSIPVGLMAAWMFGLTIVSRVIGIVRHIVPHH